MQQSEDELRNSEKALNCLRIKFICAAVVTVYFKHSHALLWCKILLNTSFILAVEQNHWDLSYRLHHCYDVCNKLVTPCTVKRTIVKYLLPSYYASFYMPGIHSFYSLKGFFHDAHGDLLTNSQVMTSFIHLFWKRPKNAGKNSLKIEEHVQVVYRRICFISTDFFFFNQRCMWSDFYQP